MIDFLNNISSTYWWLSVVIVGILINLTSHYLQKRLEVQMSSVSSWWKRRSDEQEQKKKREIDRLRGNSQEQIIESFVELRYRTRGTLLIVLAVAFLVLANLIDGVSTTSIVFVTRTTEILKTVVLAIGTISAYMGLLDHQKGVATKNLIMLARKQDNNADEKLSTSSS